MDHKVDGDCNYWEEREVEVLNKRIKRNWLKEARFNLWRDMWDVDVNVLRFLCKELKTHKKDQDPVHKKDVRGFV